MSDPCLVDLGIVGGNQVICVCDMCFIYTMTILFMTWFRAPYLPNRLVRRPRDISISDRLVGFGKL